MQIQTLPKSPHDFFPNLMSASDGVGAFREAGRRVTCRGVAVTRCTGVFMSNGRLAWIEFLMTCSASLGKLSEGDKLLKLEPGDVLKKFLGDLKYTRTRTH